MPVPAPSSAEELTVDVSQSFYFDHPLDHVPGIALVNALYELASGAERNVRDAPRADRMQSRLRFTRFCETDRKTWLSCTADGPGAQSGERRWNVLAKRYCSPTNSQPLTEPLGAKEAGIRLVSSSSRVEGSFFFRFQTYGGLAQRKIMYASALRRRPICFVRPWATWKRSSIRRCFCGCIVLPSSTSNT